MATRVDRPAPRFLTRVSDSSTAFAEEYRLRPVTLTLSARANAGNENDANTSTRWETFRGQPHLVAPLVGMIGDSVVTGMSAEGPEFVPREVLSLLPEVWNGCPICLTHPNGIESACTPETLSLYQFGVVFNGRYENGALQMEAWLSVNDAETVSPDATDCVNRILAGEPVEISICPWVRVSRSSGISPLGVAYEYRWEEILGADHVAILPSSMRGACSVDMGCGTPRALASSSVHETGDSNENKNTGGGNSMADATSTTTTAANATPATPKPKTGFLAGLSARIARISQFLTVTPQADDGTSTYELSDQLYTLLRATEPGFEFINGVYPETQAVVYCCYPGKEWKDYRRTYNLDSAGVVTLNDDRVEVVRHETWEPINETVAATPAATSTNAQCSCGANAANANANQTETVNGNVNETNTEEETMGNETGTAATTTPPASAAAPAAPAASTLSTTPASAAPAPAAPSIDRAAVLSALGITESDLLAIRAHSAAQTDRKQVLVSALAEAQDTFTADQLNAMDTATLEGIADLVAPSINLSTNYNANVVLGDFRGARPRAVANRDETYTPPDPHGVNAMLYGEVKKPASGS